MEKKLIILFLSVIFLFGSAFLILKDRDKKMAPEKTEKETSSEVVRVGYGKFVSPFFVALEKGFFNQEGVEVELQLIPDPNAIMQAMAKGNTDVAAVPYSVLFSFEQASPGNFKIFSGAIETIETPYSFLVVKDNVNRPEELKGKMIVARSGFNSKVQAELVLMGLGIKPEEIELVQVESPLTVATFAKKEIMGAIDVEPSVTAMLEKKLGKVLITAVRPRFITNPYPSVGYVFSTRFVRENNQAAEKFRRATERAIDYMKANDEESRRIMQKYLNLEEKVALLMFPCQFQKLSEIDKEAINRLRDFEFEHKFLDQKIELKDVFYAPHD